MGVLTSGDLWSDDTIQPTQHFTASQKIHENTDGALSHRIAEASLPSAAPSARPRNFKEVISPSLEKGPATVIGQTAEGHLVDMHGRQRVTKDEFLWVGNARCGISLASTFQQLHGRSRRLPILRVPPLKTQATL